MFPERSRGALRASVVVAALLLAACGSSSSGAGGGSAGGSGGAGGGSAGGGGGSGGGGAQDAGADAGLDAGIDAGPIDAGSDAGVADAGLDAGPMDAGIDAGMIPFEVEPNNGAAAGQLDSITYSGAKQGAVGVANDVDIFTVQLTAGQQIRWSLDPQPGSLLVPHLSVTETQNTVPILVTRGPVLEQLVLKSATYAVIVRDARNVPAASSQNQGSAQHTYVVSSAATARTPQVVAVPSTTNGTLATRYASALFKFTVASSQMVTVTVLAKGKAPASDLDTRLTLFNDTTKFWNGTNDDLSGSNTDSRLGGTLPAGDYLAVVDNLSETANDLTFQLQITSP